MITQIVSLKKTQDLSYPIFIGEHSLDETSRLAEYVRERTVFLLGDTHTLPLFEAKVKKNLSEAGAKEIHSIQVKVGETAKSLTHYATVMENLLSHAPDRKSLLIALGGGVVGDLCGFCSATLLRGVEFIQIPTTLLAQIDSSVGGKTGLNSSHGKNLIGAFYQPKSVFVDLSTLKTLPWRHWQAGYAELIKYALIGDAPFFKELEETNFLTLAKEYIENPTDTVPPFLLKTIAHCIKSKTDIVQQDEKRNGYSGNP